MASTVIWAAVVLLLGGAFIWCIDRRWRASLEPQEQDVAENEVTLEERRIAAEIARATIGETVELHKAQLVRQTAEADAATAIAEELRRDRLEAERAIIAARLEAEQRLAEEFVRENHAASRDGCTVASLTDGYEQYMKSTVSRGRASMSFPEFVQLLRRA
jgi:hypothetical protein